LFRDKKDPQFIPFGSPLDKDLSVGIRSGQLKLSGYVVLLKVTGKTLLMSSIIREEVAELFEPSIQGGLKLVLSTAIINC